MTPSMTQTEIKRALAPILKRIETLEKVAMKLKSPHKRHVKIPKKRRRARPISRPQR